MSPGMLHKPNIIIKAGSIGKLASDAKVPKPVMLMKTPQPGPKTHSLKPRQ